MAIYDQRNIPQANNPPTTMPNASSSFDVPNIRSDYPTLIENRGHVNTSTLQERVSTAIGRFIVCEFLIGTSNMVTRSGILADVGNSYLALFDPCSNSTTACDLYAMKFITVYPEGYPDTNALCTFKRHNGHLFR